MDVDDVPPAVAVDECSAQEWEQIQDDAARLYLGVSREEFLAGWRDGRFGWGHDHPDHCAIVRVALLFPELD